MNRDLEQYLLRISDSRRSLWACLQDLSQEELTRINVEGPWTIKDLIGHFTAWDISLLSPLKIYLESGAFSPEIIHDHDAWNALQADLRKHRTLADILEESKLVREELLATVAKLTDPQWNKTFPEPAGLQPNPPPADRSCAMVPYPPHDECAPPPPTLTAPFQAHVLLVEDDEALGRNIEDLLNLDGFQVTRSEDRSFSLASGCADIEILNNTVTRANKYGIYVSDCRRVRVANNRTYDNYNHGIRFTVGASSCVIEGNESYRNAVPGSRQANGLYMYGASGNVVRRNNWHDNQDSGQHMQSGANNNISYDNVSWNNGDHGYDNLGFARG